MSDDVTKNGEAEPQELDYESMTADELDALMLKESMEAEFPQALAEPEEPAEEAVEEPAEEVAEGDAPPEEPVEEVAAEPDERELELTELRLEMERMRQDRERFELLAGRSSGEVGFLKKELARLRSAPPQRDDDFDELAETTRVQPQPSAPSHLEDQVAELRQQATASAVERVYADFLSRVKDDLTAQGVEQDKLQSEQEAVLAKITPTLRDRFEPFGDVSTLGAKSLQKVTRMVLEGAYTDYRLQKVADLRRELSERKASQIAQSKIVKQAASPSGSGGKSVKEPPQKSVSDMTAEEADAAMIAQYGDGRGRIRSRR